MSHIGAVWQCALRLARTGGLFLLLFATPAIAVDVVPVTCAKVVDMAQSTRIVEDPAGIKTAEEILRLPPSGLSAPGVRELIPGYSEATWWLRVTMRNQDSRACRAWFLAGPGRLRGVTLFLSRENAWQTLRTGSALPFDQWASSARQPVFPLDLAPGETVTAVVRIHSEATLLSFTPQFWPDRAWRQSQVDDGLLDGAVFGGTCALVAIGLALGAVFRRIALIYMSLGVLSYTVYVAILDNYAFVYLWPESPAFNFFATHMAVCITMFMSNGYCGTVVGVDRLGKPWAWGLRSIRGSFLIAGMVSAFTTATWPVIVAALILDLLVRLYLLIALVAGFSRGLVRSWYPPLLVLLITAQVAITYSFLLGHVSFYSPNNPRFATTVLPGALLLLGTLISQVTKGRRQELSARDELSQLAASEQSRLEHTVEVRTMELRRALAARNHLLARISHDLRSPLANVIDSVRQWRSGDTTRDHAGLVERNTRLQLEMIDELLEFSRDELTEIEVLEVAGYLRKFLYDVVEHAQVRVEKNGNRFLWNFSDELAPLVWADFRRLRQVLGNLLGNAAKFTSHGLVKLDVRRMRADGAGMTLRFTVEDNGIGIDAGDHDHLLLPFVRGKNAANHAGSGLGLAIVRQLLGAMGSALEIEGVPGGGSRFYFELHLLPAKEDELDLAFDLGDGLEIEGQGRVVLVVDDDPQSRYALCDLLDGCDFDTIAVADGEAALEVLSGRHIDLVLTDQSMPGMGGWPLLLSIREAMGLLPVVLYSSLPPMRPANLDRSLVFDAVLLKPASAKELLACLAEVMAFR